MSIVLRLLVRLLGPWAAIIALLLASALDDRAASVVATGTSIGVATPRADGYARPEWLADAGWLTEHLGDPGLRVVALTPADAFERGHIPGAVQIDWPDLEVTDTADPLIARWQGAVEATLTRLGIAPTDTVVVYDDGTLFAARLWWVLHQLGHEDKRILNGGLAAWRAAGGEIETTGTWYGYSPSNPYRGSPRPEALAQLPEVEAALGDPGVALVDARAPDEYAAGHIPGAVNLEFTANALPDAPRYWKSAAELRAMYEAAGVTPDQRVIPYCTTGVRSAVTYFTLGLLGYEDVALYTGSWAEWSAHPELPRATGVAP